MIDLYQTKDMRNIYGPQNKEQANFVLFDINYEKNKQYRSGVTTFYIGSAGNNRIDNVRCKILNNTGTICDQLNLFKRTA